MRGHTRTYNAIAGRSIDRLNAISDGLFAFAMTVMVLDIRVPAHASIHTEVQLWLAIVSLAPQFVTYLLSFLTLGIFWVAQQTQLERMREADRDFTWLHLLFLAAVAVLPLTTRLLAEYITFRVALALYWANIL
ncbi:TMEM175 family protein, partial [Phenylobacterium sp.]|uniref:TMEM175 family protein n=1 Tax=Phenylobacterium sp. TaxID=1871053 RepID=UPI00121A85CA